MLIFPGSKVENWRIIDAVISDLLRWKLPTYLKVLVPRFSPRLESSVQLRPSGMSRVECSKLSSVSTNIAVAVYRVKNIKHSTLLIPEGRSCAFIKCSDDGILKRVFGLHGVRCLVFRTEHIVSGSGSFSVLRWKLGKNLQSLVLSVRKLISVIGRCEVFMSIWEKVVVWIVALWAFWLRTSVSKEQTASIFRSVRMWTLRPRRSVSQSCRMRRGDRAVAGSVGRTAFQSTREEVRT
jgi:hypothetical protein